jgi:hypothetical protein
MIEGAAQADDRPTRALDDEVDREELRRRYYGLLQELRVLLPGVQILVAFLLTAPFASAFHEVDGLGQDLYGVSLVTGALAVIVFVAPTVFHRVGPRRSRVARLEWGVRLLRVGLVLFGISLLSAVALIWRFVFGGAAALPATFVLAVAMAGVWVLLPRDARHLSHRLHGSHGSHRSPSDARSDRPLAVRDGR